MLTARIALLNAALAAAVEMRRPMNEAIRFAEVEGHPLLADDIRLQVAAFDAANARLKEG